MACRRLASGQKPQFRALRLPLVVPTQLLSRRLPFNCGFIVMLQPTDSSTTNRSSTGRQRYYASRRYGTPTYQVVNLSCCFELMQFPSGSNEAIGTSSFLI
jgi:hypothetical protein